MAEPGPPNAQGPPVSATGLDHIDINAIPDAPGETPECRICGGPAEPDAPLFYPCKCSGTIRYIHQAWYVRALCFGITIAHTFPFGPRERNKGLCALTLPPFPNWRVSLTTWLKHSKKQSCDLCKHPYAFTKGISDGGVPRAMTN